jgi:hypothetical protein
MEDERASHLLCKDRHAAFGLKKVQIPHRACAKLKQVQNKEEKK